MCGICGLLAPDVADPALVQAMNDAIVHRGPDHGAVAPYGRCTLAYRRLSIIDLQTGDQPLENENGSVVAVFNGELYNFRELRRELEAKGHLIRGTGDSPLIPHAYEEWGAGFASSGSRGCSRSRSGTARPSGSCSRATGSGRSRCSMPSCPTARLPSPPRRRRSFGSRSSLASSTCSSSTPTSRSSTCRAPG